MIKAYFQPAILLFISVLFIAVGCKKPELLHAGPEGFGGDVVVDISQNSFIYIGRVLNSINGEDRFSINMGQPSVSSLLNGLSFLELSKTTLLPGDTIQIYHWSKNQNLHADIPVSSFTVNHGDMPAARYVADSLRENWLIIEEVLENERRMSIIFESNLLSTFNHTDNWPGRLEITGRGWVPLPDDW